MSAFLKKPSDVQGVRMQKTKVTSSLVQTDAQTELVSLQVYQESYRTVIAILRVTTSLWTAVATTRNIVVTT